MKTFRLFSMAALALVMAACSNNDDEIKQPAQQQGMIPFCATIAAPNSGATTRTTYTEVGTSINVAWKNGDQIALIHNGVKDVVTVGDPNLDGSAPISGSITAPASDEEDVVLVYPAASVEASGTGTGITPVVAYLTKGLTQDGTLDYISNYLDSRRGSGKIISDGGSGGTLKENVKMASQIAIWKLSLQDNAATPNALSAIAVTVNVGSTTVAAAAAAAKSDYYLCLVPATMGSGDLTIDATVSSDTYTYTKAGGVSLTAGKFYQSTVTLSKPAPAATSLSELKTAINGGTDCSSYIGWEVNSAGAIAESGISGTKIGYVAYVSTSDVDAGVSGSRILVLADADAGTSILWGSKGTSRGLTADDLNGYSKTNTLQGYGSGAHPAAYAAWNYSATIPSGGASPAHWFMPTKEQWENMRDVYSGGNLAKRNAMVSAYGIDGSYWASTEDNQDKAYRFSTNGNMQSNVKSNNYNVRSIFAY